MCGSYLDVIERGVKNLVIIRKAIDALVVHVDKDVMVKVNAVHVRVSIGSSALEIDATNETAVDICCLQ